MLPALPCAGLMVSWQGFRALCDFVRGKTVALVVICRVLFSTMYAEARGSSVRPRPPQPATSYSTLVC